MRASSNSHESETQTKTQNQNKKHKQKHRSQKAKHRFQRVVTQRLWCVQASFPTLTRIMFIMRAKHRVQGLRPWAGLGGSPLSAGSGGGTPPLVVDRTTCDRKYSITFRSLRSRSHRHSLMYPFKKSKGILPSIPEHKSWSEESECDDHTESDTVSDELLERLVESQERLCELLADLLQILKSNTMTTHTPTSSLAKTLSTLATGLSTISQSVPTTTHNASAIVSQLTPSTTSSHFT